MRELRFEEARGVFGAGDSPANQDRRRRARDRQRGGERGDVVERRRERGHASVKTPSGLWSQAGNGLTSWEYSWKVHGVLGDKFADAFLLPLRLLLRHALPRVARLRQKCAQAVAGLDRALERRSQRETEATEARLRAAEVALRRAIGGDGTRERIVVRPAALKGPRSERLGDPFPPR